MTFKGGDPERGRKLLELRAGQCHTCEKGGANGIGPNLFGVVGRLAGTSSGYAYSKANTHSGVVWTETELDIYLTNPSKYMPGTQMAFAGLKREKDRADVIAFLQGLQ